MQEEPGATNPTGRLSFRELVLPRRLTNSVIKASSSNKQQRGSRSAFSTHRAFGRGVLAGSMTFAVAAENHTMSKGYRYDGRVWLL
jgi:hypothetical protein